MTGAGVALNRESRTERQDETCGLGWPKTDVDTGMLRRQRGAREERFQPEIERWELSAITKAMRNYCQRREKVKFKN